MHLYEAARLWQVWVVQTDWLRKHAGAQELTMLFVSGLQAKPLALFADAWDHVQQELCT